MFHPGFIRYIVQVFRDPIAEPLVDAISGGVGFFVVLCEAGFAEFSHRWLLFYPTIDLGSPWNKTHGSIHEPVHFGCGTFDPLRVSSLWLLRDAGGRS
jgi:hypothetical protein